MKIVQGEAGVRSDQGVSLKQAFKCGLQFTKVSLKNTDQGEAGVASPRVIFLNATKDHQLTQVIQLRIQCNAKPVLDRRRVIFLNADEGRQLTKMCHLKNCARRSQFLFGTGLFV